MVNTTKIWLSSPHLGLSEEIYVKDAFNSNWVAPVGANISSFENKLERFLEDDVNVVALSSGTSAIHLAMAILGIGKGDEVLCQSFTFTASASPVLYQGAYPIFIDSEKETWNMSPDLLTKAIEERMSLGKKPKAIVPVAIYGMPYKVNEIREIADYYDIPIIEDSAEALGSTFQGRKCGTFGDIGIFSFNGNKIVTTSGGGALVTRNIKVKEKASFLANHAQDDAPHYQHSSLGYNYGLSNILAGIGSGQMEVLEDRIEARRANFQFYRNTLSGISGLEFLEEPKGFYSNRWLTCVLFPCYSIREKVRKGLMEDNIESRPLMKPLHSQPMFKDCVSYTNGISEDLFDRGLCLPSGSNLNTDDLNFITTQIIKLLNDD
ncbi:MAG: DegT/DnrJ/EryC1/StrS family aminotransferase [Flavobacteriaceae bacterium]